MLTTETPPAVAGLKVAIYVDGFEWQTQQQHPTGPDFLLSLFVFKEHILHGFLFLNNMAKEMDLT